MGIGIVAAIWLASGVARLASPLRPPSLDPRRVVVGTFANGSGDRTLDPVGQLAVDYVAQGVAQLRSLEVVAAEDFPGEEGAPASSAARGWRLRSLAAKAGAATMISGSYYGARDSLEFRTQLADVQTGNVIAALAPVRVPRADVRPALAEVRERVAGGLAVLTDTLLGAWALPAGQPPTYAAYQELANGLQMFFADRPTGEPDIAAEIRAHFARAATLDTSYIQPRLWLAWYNTVWYFKGAAADSLLRPLEQARDRLSPFESAFMDALRLTLNGDVVLTPDAWQRVASISPMRYFRQRQAQTLAVANRPREALAILEQIGPGQGSDAEAHWEEMADIRHYLGEHEAELEATRALRRPGPQNPWALLHEVNALAALGRVGELEQRLEDVLATPLNPHAHELAPGDFMTVAALELRAHGHAEAAAGLARRALAWYAGRPPDKDFRFVALGLTGQWQNARRLAERALARDPENLFLRGFVGQAAAHLGDRAAVDRISREFASMDQPGLRGFHTLERAKIAAALGDYDGAVALAREAVGQGLPLAAQLDIHREVAFEPLRANPAFRRLIQPQR